MTALHYSGSVRLPIGLPELPSGEWWNLLTTASGAGVALFTPEGRCTYLNPRAMETCAVDPNSTEFDAVAVLGAESAEVLRQELWKVSTFQKSSTCVLNIRCVLHEATLVPVSTPHAGVLLVARPHAIPVPVDSKSLSNMMTPRELQILAAIGTDTPVPETCQSLDISAKTYRNYVAMIGRKLNVATRTEMACIAVRTGLVSRPVV